MTWTQHWMLIVRVLITSGVVFLLIGLALGGRVGGGLVILSGAEIAVVGMSLLGDVAGTGRMVGTSYLNFIGVKGSRAASASSSQRQVAWITGLGLAIVGFSSCVVGVVLVVR